jgi:HupE / UreJ protein
MRFFEPMKIAEHLLRVACFAALFAFAAAANAHKSSDSYLQIDAADKGLAVRWDIALRDLDAALDLDADEDGKLTWGEVKAAWPRIQSYALGRLAIEGCALRPTGQALERRNDGAYAVLMLAADCTLGAAPVITYSLFREVDPTHRGIAKVQRTGQPVALSMLDPTRAATAAAAGSTPAPTTTTAETDAPAHAAAPTGAWGFLREGIRHILTGYDHVLFLLCLLLPSVMRRTPQGWKAVDKLSQAVWPVVGIVSAFTVAHSITLGLAAMKVVSLSPSFIEPAIAVTIILAALDNVWPIFPVRRVVVTFFFGLIHGFGFAGVLAELNLPTAQFAWALLQFNLGLELGQLMIVVSVTAVLFLLRPWPRYRVWVIRGGSMAAMLVGVLWLIERTANVSLLSI